MRHAILIIEDNEDLLAFLKEMLEREKFVVRTLSSGAGALRVIEQFNPNVIMLDLNLPDIDGKSILSSVKQEYPTLPTLILTGSESTSDLVESFGKGADDYLTKPFNNDELLARIYARLPKDSDKDVLEAGDIVLNRAVMEVQRAGKEVELSSTEFKLLEYLLINSDRVLSREQILSHVWAYDVDITTRVVDVYVGYLRKKLGESKQNKTIFSKRGVGYMFKKHT